MLSLECKANAEGRTSDIQVSNSLFDSVLIHHYFLLASLGHSSLDFLERGYLTAATGCMLECLLNYRMC